MRQEQVYLKRQKWVFPIFLDKKFDHKEPCLKYLSVLLQTILQA